MTQERLFKVNDYIVRGSSTKIAQIIDIGRKRSSGYYGVYTDVRFRYIDSLAINGARFEEISHAPEELLKRKNLYHGKPQMKTQELYTIDRDGVTRFAKILQDYKNNQVIIETRSSGEYKQEVIVVDKNELTEVVPYTAGIEIGGTVVHVEVPENLLSVNDLLVLDSQLGVVKSLNTKKKDDLKVFNNVHRVNAEKINLG